MKRYEEYQLSTKKEAMRENEENATVIFLKKVPREDNLYNVYADYAFLPPEETTDDFYCNSNTVDSDVYISNKNGISLDTKIDENGEILFDGEVKHVSDIHIEYFRKTGLEIYPYVFENYYPNGLISNINIYTNNGIVRVISFIYDDKGRLICKLIKDQEMIIELKTVNEEDEFSYSNYNEVQSTVYNENNLTSKTKIYQKGILVKIDETQWDKDFMHKLFTVTRDVFSNEIINIEKYNYNKNGEQSIIIKSL